MTNSGALYAYSGRTNASLYYGALVSVASNVFLANSAWVYLLSQATNGGSPVLRTRNLTISTVNAGIDANGGGYGVKAGANGYGPGGGTNAGSNYGGGGGYGGVGGRGNNAGAGGGKTYGSMQSPTDPGSGGGSYNDATLLGGPGGGLARVEVSGVMTLNGTVRANGAGGMGGVGGGGSGGGIYLSCKVLSGTNAVLAAVGGSNGRSDYGGAGGGGRIAVWRMFESGVNTNTWSFSVAGGTVPAGGGASNGFPGTVFFGMTPIPEPGIFIQLK